MQSMSAYAYLNIDDPMCAWATYRDVLVPRPDAKGFVSVWLAGILQSEKWNRYLIEQRLESVREQNYPSCVSRLQGMFCFIDLESAKLAAKSWGGDNSNHFSTSYLAELELSSAIDSLQQFDANWITWAHENPKYSLRNDSWIDKYWSGQPYPEKEPIWESLYAEEMIVLGTELRERAYERVKNEFPDCLALLEIARISALLGSTLGLINGFISNTSDGAELKYCMDMQDAENLNFLKELEEFRQSGQPVNRKDLQQHFSNPSLTFPQSPEP